jgi:hypothetical protein
MLLPDAMMQISCLKDLATLRNPSSPFTFLSYLHEHGRLVSFINRGSTVPTRREFADYLAWAANKVRSLGVEIFYGEEMTSLEAKDQRVIHCISQKDGQTIIRLTGMHNSSTRSNSKSYQKILLSHPEVFPEFQTCSLHYFHHLWYSIPRPTPSQSRLLSML